MEVLTKIENCLDLVPLTLPFSYIFTFKKKSNGDEFWLTNGGKAKIWVGGLDLETVGAIVNENSYVHLTAEMKKTKSDALRLRDVENKLSPNMDIYTFTNEGVVKVKNLNFILQSLLNEYEARKDWEMWEDINVKL